MSEKWHTVGKKDRKGKKESGQHGDHSKLSSRSVGLQQSNTAFSQWSTLEQTREADTSRDVGGEVGEEVKEHVRHRGKGKKEKRMKTHVSFDEVVGKLDAASVKEYIENVKHENPESPLVWLKEMTSHFQQQFKSVQTETDFTFSHEDPGYPASALQTSLHSHLVSLLRPCPSLVLESLYRHCLDCLLGEVRKGLPSHGTRLVIQLVREARAEVCTAASERIQLLLQSCGTKVPETLSLLWAGLPHPEIYPAVSLGAWQCLCLPFLHEVHSASRQVLNYCLDYTCLILKHLGPEESTELSRCLHSTTVCAILSSPAIVSRRSQSNVQEMYQMLQEHIIRVSGKDLVRHFSTSFVQLGHTENNQLLMEFTVSCIRHSSTCLSSWRDLAPSHVASSQLLLEYLVQHWATIGLSLKTSPLANTLSSLETTITVDEHKQLCQNLLGRLQQGSVKTDGTQSGGRRCGCGSVLCVLLITIIAVTYLAFLCVFLKHVATHGPELEIELLTKLMSPNDWSHLLDQATQVMWDGITWFLRHL